MHMMKCPKCSFEQPEDQFCANCGVNITNFRPSRTIGSGLRSVLMPIIFVSVLIALVYVLFKAVETRMTPTLSTETDIEESTQFGVKTGSLNSPKQRPKSRPQPSTALNNIQATSSVKETRTAEKFVPQDKKFNQIHASFTVAEHGLDFEVANENASGIWHLVSHTNPINSFTTEDVTLKLGSNSFEFVDNLIRYDVSINVEEITDKEVTVKIDVRRAMAGAQSSTASVTTNVPLDQNLIIIDSLPRRAGMDRPNSILSTLYKSQLFLSRASELVQIIKFDNPSNSPQESLTP